MYTSFCVDRIDFSLFNAVFFHLSPKTTHWRQVYEWPRKAWMHQAVGEGKKRGGGGEEKKKAHPGVIFNILFSLSPYRPATSVMHIALILPLSFIPVSKISAKLPRGSSFNKYACWNALLHLCYNSYFNK